MQRLCTLCGLSIKHEAQVTLDDPFNDNNSIEGIGCVCTTCERTLTRTSPGITAKARMRLKAKA